MQVNEVVKIIREHNNRGRFVITLSNGKKLSKRMFINSYDDLPCFYHGCSRTYGHYVSKRDIEENWVKFEIHKEVDDVVKVRNFMKKVVKYLEKSGLWKDMLHSYTTLLKLSDEELSNLISMEWSDQRNWLNEKKLSFFCDSILYTVRKGIKTINLDSYDRNMVISHIKENIKNKTNMYHSWRKDYDNHVELKFDNDMNRGWYSEEYKGCGNGHYYLLIDERHVIYYEKD